MNDLLFVCAGLSLIAVAQADLVNTLVSTSTSSARWWPSQAVGRCLFVVFRSVAKRLGRESALGQRLLHEFGPFLVIVLLALWVTMQITGFALIWLTFDGFDAIGGFADAWYYSGVVYFTVGFGEIVPPDLIPQAGALIEAFFGVITIALVIGYLPTLYNAYSDRERTLMTLDNGSTERITPLALLKSWSPDADPKKIDAQFARWEEWAAGILETHSTVPLLVLFRSHDRRQNWVTALGLLSDAAVLSQAIKGATDGNNYSFLRRAEAIFRESTDGVDLTSYIEQMEANASPELLRAAYDELADHGFDLRPFDEAVAYGRQARQAFGPAMEYLIDYLYSPRGFWPLNSTVVSWSTMYPLPRHDETADDTH